jgi:hypothetical protein
VRVKSSRHTAPPHISASYHIKPNPDLFSYHLRIQLSDNRRSGEFVPPTGGGLGRSSSSAAAVDANAVDSCPDSPTSRAMNMLLPLLRHHQQTMAAKAAASGGDTSDVVPLQMLPYFRFLNEAAQR